MTDTTVRGKRRVTIRRHEALHRPRRLPAVAPFVLAAAMVAYLIAYTTRLGHAPTSVDYLQILNAALPGVFVALGQSLVVITGGLDLSIGGVAGLCGAVAAVEMPGDGLTAFLWLPVILLLGGVCGLVNGIVIAKARIASTLATLATGSVFLGMAQGVLPIPGGSMAHGVRTALSNQDEPIGLVWFGLALGAWFVLRRTRLGLYMFAVGSNEDNASTVGVPTKRVKIIVYGLSGLCSAFAAVFGLAATNTGDTAAGTPLVLGSIAAVVVGGVAFGGGQGSAASAMAGAVALTLVINVVFFVGLNPSYASMYPALFLITAAVLGLATVRFTPRGRGADR